MKKLFTVMFAMIVLAAAGQDNYEEALDKAENWVKKTYTEGSFAYRSAVEKLKKIYESEKSEKEKIEELRNKFPKAFSSAGEKGLPSKTPADKQRGSTKTGPAGEGLIVRDALVWKIHSLSLGYDIKESAVSETKTHDILKELEVRDASRQDAGADRESRDIKKVSTASSK